MTFSELYLNIRKYTIKKLINASVLYIGYWLSIVIKHTNRSAYPASISIEPTSICNLKCPECPTGRDELIRYKGDIDNDLYKKIIDELSPYLLNLILYFQGEPYLNKDFFKLVEYASKKKKVFTTSSTNGHFLNKENARKTILSGLDKLIISIDGTTQEVYEQYRRNGDFQTVISGIKNLVELKDELKSKTPFIVIQFLVFKNNEHQIKDIKKISKELKVDKLELKSAQVYDFENNTELIPNITKYSRYKLNKDGKYKIKSKLKNKCRRLWESSVITNKGEILPCCFDKHADHTFGNINKRSFREINNNQKSKTFRKQLLIDRSQTDICRNCTEGLYR